MKLLYYFIPMLVLSLYWLLNPVTCFASNFNSLSLGYKTNNLEKHFKVIGEDPFLRAIFKKRNPMKMLNTYIKRLKSKQVKSLSLSSRRRGIPSTPKRRFSMSEFLILGNVIMFFVTNRYPGLQEKLLKVDYYIIRRHEYYRLFTSLFLHANFYHLMMNSYSLYQLGPQAERIFGKTAFTMIYLGSGLLANIGTLMARTSPLSLGASGCTFGIIGAFAGYYYVNRRILGRESEIGEAQYNVHLQK